MDGNFKNEHAAPPNTSFWLKLKRRKKKWTNTERNIHLNENDEYTKNIAESKCFRIKKSKGLNEIFPWEITKKVQNKQTFT